MFSVSRRKPFGCYLLIVLHLFLGLGALFGGGALIFSPDGSLLKMPLEMLEHSPFESFLIPGIILFVVLGVIPIFIAFYLIFEKSIPIAEKLSLYQNIHWAWNGSLYMGFTLIIWIGIELYMIQGIAFIHILYLFLGLIIQAVTLLPSVKQHYSQNTAYYLK